MVSEGKIIQVDVWVGVRRAVAAASRGCAATLWMSLHGEPRGEVVVGRPLKFGEEMRQVGFKEPIRKIELIDRRASQLGLKRSDYLRQLVDRDLDAAGIEWGA